MNRVNLIVNRISFGSKQTTGEMLVSVNGETPKHLCYTLEDTDRGLDSSMSYNRVMQLKKYGETAIPTGTYKVYKHFWTKHKKHVPGLESVTGFAGILIHSGVTDKDTFGCILVSKGIITDITQNSREASTEVTKLVLDHLQAGDEVYITIDRIGMKAETLVTLNAK